MTSRMMRSAACSVLAAAALVVGCGQADGPMAPDGAPQASASGPSVKALARYSGGPPSITVAWAKKWIGPEGGTLSWMGFSVVVPAGAVDKVTQFSIRLPVDPKNNEYVMAEFGPHGQKFAVPVTLHLPLAGTTSEGTAANVLWWNGSSWEVMPTTQVDGHLEAPTTHFSTYGTEDTQRGYTLAGG